jgi:ribosomal protein L11 methyltransferase
MRWVTITIPLPLSLLDSICNFLWPHIQGLMIEPQGDIFVLRSFLFTEDPGRILKRLQRILHIQGKTLQEKCATPELSELNEGFEDDFLIVPAPVSCVPPPGIPIFIERGRAFGIGSHPCTIYCLQALRQIFRVFSPHINTRNILDAGAGTGILSIAAAKLGAAHVTGVEISREAVMEAQENIRLNECEEAISVVQGSVTDIQGDFDLILANLYGSLLLEIGSSLIRRLSPGGWIVLGGMGVPQNETVIRFFVDLGLDQKLRYADSAWSACILQKASW